MQAASRLIQIHSQGFLLSAGCELRYIPPLPRSAYLKKRPRPHRILDASTSKKKRRFLGPTRVAFKAEVLVLSPENGPDFGTALFIGRSVFLASGQRSGHLHEVGFGGRGLASKTRWKRGLLVSAFFLTSSSGTCSRAPHCCRDAFHLRLKRLNHL